MLFLLLGAIYGDDISRGIPVKNLLVSGMIGYGCANTAFAGLAITLVLRREQAILKRLRATPLPLATYVSAVLGSTMVIFALQTIGIFALGGIIYGTKAPPQIASMVALVAIGAVAFACMGVGLASLIRSSEGASAVVNVILLPMAFLSGSFGPTHDFPRFLRAIGAVLPLKYFIQLVETVFIRGHAVWTRPGALGILAAWALGGLAVAWHRFSWAPIQGG
jgi:ABC-2 type transport system permease protein